MARPLSIDDIDLPSRRFVFDAQEKYEHVMSQISSLNLKEATGSKFSWMLCPYHNERTPSGRINHDSAHPEYAGSYRCYGCGIKKTWNEFASDQNLEPYGALNPDKELEVPKSSGRFGSLDKDLLGSGREVLSFKSLSKANAESVGLLESEWRGYPLGFLRELGAKLATVEYFSGDMTYVWLPTLVRGEVKGYIKAQLFKPEDKSTPSYINSSGPWSLTHGLFPYDYAVSVMEATGKSSIVLVEGPRDALRLLHLGYPALCILGTHSWSEDKLRLLKMTGAERIVLMFDGDEAGKLATDLVYSGKMTRDSKTTRVAEPLKQAFQSTKVVRLWNLEQQNPEEKNDPGNLPENVLLSILKKVVI